MFIPNEPSATYALQAEPDAGDFEILLAGYLGTGVMSGCAVTAHGDLSVDVAAGVIISAGKTRPVAAVNVALAAANATYSRFDLITVTAAGVVAAITGGPVAHPAFPAIPAGAVVLAAVLVGPGVAVLTSSTIVDKRVIISAAPPTVIDVRAKGSRGDGVYVTDGAMTAGSAVLTSASAPFTAAHVGRPIAVAGAGTAAGNFKHTIASYTSPTQVTLDTVAGTTVAAAAVVIGDDSAALVDAGTAVTQVDGKGSIYFAQGAHVAREQIADLEPPAGGGYLTQGVRIFGDGPGVSFLVIGDDLGGNALFNLMGRHGTSNSDREGSLLVHDLTIVTPGWAWNGDGFNFWQGRDVTFRNVEFVTIKGTPIGVIACDRVKILGVRADRCGDGSAGAPTIMIVQNDEGGFVNASQRCTDVVIADTILTGNDDHGVYAEQVYGLTTRGLIIDGAGAHRACFYGLDLVDVDAEMECRNATDSDLVLGSLGAAEAIRIRGRFSGALGSNPGTGWGVRVAKVTSAQTFTGVVIDGTFGSPDANVAGSVDAPIDGSVLIGADAVSLDTVGFPMPPRGIAMVTLSSTPATPNCLVANEFTIQLTVTPFTIAAPVNPRDGQVIVLIVKNTSGGVVSLSWPASFEWGGALVPVAPADTKKNVYTFAYSTAAAKWRETSVVLDVR